MDEAQFGGIKLSFGVVQKADGRIEVRVYHANKGVRGEIALNKSNPSYFLSYLSFSYDNPRAKYWLAQVVKAYRSYFANNLVDFVLK